MDSDRVCGRLCGGAQCTIDGHFTVRVQWQQRLLSEHTQLWREPGQLLQLRRVCATSETSDDALRDLHHATTTRCRGVS